jgi:hypothetical protein
MRAIGQRIALSFSDSYAASCRCAAKAASLEIHNHWRSVMDSGLAAFGGAPE